MTLVKTRQVLKTHQVLKTRHILKTRQVPKTHQVLMTRPSAHILGPLATGISSCTADDQDLLLSTSVKVVMFCLGLSIASASQVETGMGRHQCVNVSYYLHYTQNMQLQIACSLTQEILALECALNFFSDKTL